MSAFLITALRSDILNDLRGRGVGGAEWWGGKSSGRGGWQRCGMWGGKGERGGG